MIISYWHPGTGLLLALLYLRAYRFGGNRIGTAAARLGFYSLAAAWLLLLAGSIALHAVF